MNSGWQLVTAEMMDRVREPDCEFQNRPNRIEWVFVLEQTSHVNDVRQASRDIGTSVRLMPGLLG